MITQVSPEANVYQAAIDHCQIHGWPLEEALALELHGMLVTVFRHLIFHAKNKSR